MAIIGQVEKKNWKVKLLNVIIHVILITGATTMVYPLLLMLSGSFKSAVDFKNFNIIPEFVYDDTALFRKYLFTKYNGGYGFIKGILKEPNRNIDTLEEPKTVSTKRVEDYSEFLKEMRETLPHYWRVIGMANEFGVYPLSLRNYREFMQKKYGKDKTGIDKMNDEYSTDYGAWDEISLPSETFTSQRATTSYTTGMFPSVLEFKNSEYVTPLTTSWPDFDGAFIDALRRDASRNLAEINKQLGTNLNSWQEVTLSATLPENPKLAKIWENFVKNDINFIFVTLDADLVRKDWQNYLKSKNTDITDINNTYGTKWKNFDEAEISSVCPESGQYRADWSDFVREKASGKALTLDTLGLRYRDWLREKYGSLDKLNEAYGNGYGNFSEIPLPELPPEEDNLAMTKDWNEFVNTLDSKDIALARQSASNYRNYLQRLYSKPAKGDEEPECDFEAMSRDYNLAIKNANYIPSHVQYPEGKGYSDKAREDYLKIVRDPEFADLHRLEQPENFKGKWEEFLRKKYTTIDALNKAWGTVATEWAKIHIPAKEYEWDLMLKNKSFLIKEYLKRNYLMVMDTLFTNGNAAMNTLIYCFLAVLAALLVNPLCAYGLSRFKPASSYKILLFLMLPMAFPGMVLGIPQFLLIKDFGLLNTFAALILPSMAQGYSIFLLKGFFDSLPKELFESAAIDGASEWTVFWHIAMSLSTPILSVIALGAFTGAYGNFMLAFLLCQEKSMWTMMVYLYQLQQRSSQAVGFAALIIAAIPTLIVFIFCQNIIIKGIVVPTEK